MAETGSCRQYLSNSAKLRERRHIGHPIQEQFADQMIHLVLDTDRVETGRFEIHRFAITIQRLNSHD